MLTADPQVAPLIEVYELYLLRDAALDQMREPTIVATRAVLDSGMSPEIVLLVLEGALQAAVAALISPDAAGMAEQLRERLGPWLLGECFQPAGVTVAPPMKD